jgi:hypothetical protein
MSSAIWRTGDEASGWRYRFNVFQLANDGLVHRTFRPADLTSFVPLVRVLALAIAEDGCVDARMRLQLEELADFCAAWPSQSNA